jgi:hypothetical protein
VLYYYIVYYIYVYYIYIIYMYIIYILYNLARMGEGRCAYRVLVGRPEGRRPLGRPRRRWEDNIKVDLQEVGWGAWTGLIWLRIGTGGGLL